jgi:hypothetical protein
MPDAYDFLACPDEHTSDHWFLDVLAFPSNAQSVELRQHESRILRAKCIARPDLSAGDMSYWGMPVMLVCGVCSRVVPVPDKMLRWASCEHASAREEEVRMGLPLQCYTNRFGLRKERRRLTWRQTALEARLRPDPTTQATFDERIAYLYGDLPAAAIRQHIGLPVFRHATQRGTRSHVSWKGHASSRLRRLITIDQAPACMALAASSTSFGCAYQWGITGR